MPLWVVRAAQKRERYGNGVDLLCPWPDLFCKWYSYRDNKRNSKQTSKRHSVRISRTLTSRTEMRKPNGKAVLLFYIKINYVTKDYLHICQLQNPNFNILWTIKRNAESQWRKSGINNTIVCTAYSLASNPVLHALELTVSWLSVVILNLGRIVNKIYTPI